MFYFISIIACYTVYFIVMSLEKGWPNVHLYQFCHPENIRKKVRNEGFELLEWAQNIRISKIGSVCQSLQKGNNGRLLPLGKPKRLDQWIPGFTVMPP